MSSENTTIQLQNKATWYVRFQRKAGRILGVSPQLINKVNDDEEVAVIDNELCKDLVSGKKNLRKYAVHWDVIKDKWDIDFKSDTLVLKTTGNKLNQFSENLQPAECDMFIKVIRPSNMLSIRVNLMRIRSQFNLGQVHFLKYQTEDILDLYVCRRNNPDYLIGIISIDSESIFKVETTYVEVPKEITHHINSWDDVSIFAKPVFNSYGIEFTDIYSMPLVDNDKLHRTSNTSLESHINMYTLNDNLIIDSKLTDNMKHYLKNQTYLQLHVSDSYIDNYVTTLTISMAELLNNKVKLEIPANWPANPLVAFADTELAVNYITEKQT